MSTSKVYFLKKEKGKDINPEHVINVYEKVIQDLPEKDLGKKVACKVHSGEKGNRNFITPDFWVPIWGYLKNHEQNPKIVECNTAYNSERNSTEKHKKIMELHKWYETFGVDNVDIADEYEKVEQDKELTIEDGFQIKKNYIGSHLDTNYDSMIVLAHFKGHGMGGFGGALKQLSIGCASLNGKAYQHTGGRTTSPEEYRSGGGCSQNEFLDSMADAASSVVRYFKEMKRPIVYINVMKNISTYCDCASIASPPCMHDVGILGSVDPVAIDQACIDLVLADDDPGKQALIDRINNLNGIRTVKRAEEHKIGSRLYDLINIDY